MRVGVNTGEAVVTLEPSAGNGFVTGDVVNTAARIESEVAAPGEIVISGATYERVKDRVKVRPLGSRALRGRTAPLEVYAVEG